MTAPVRPWTTRIANAIPAWMAARPGLLHAWKILWVHALLCDLAIQSALQGMRAAWPGYDGRTDNLPLIGQSRGLIQGETEAPTAFASRLRSWLVSATQMGGSIGLATQLQTWIAGNPAVTVICRCLSAALGGLGAQYTAALYGGASVVRGSATVTFPSAQTLLAGSYVTFQWQPGYSYTLAAAVTAGTSGTLTTPYTGPTSSGWCTAQCYAPLDWDSVSNPERQTFWWDFGIVVFTSKVPGGYYVQRGTWAAYEAGGGTWAPGFGIGLNSTLLEADTIRGLVATWKGQHANCRALVFCPNDALFQPGTPAAAGNPDGTWGKWFSTSTNAPSRNRALRYMSLGGEVT